MSFTKDSLIFLLGGMVVGLITGVLIVTTSAPRTIQGAQQPVASSSSKATEGALPEGHPPVDETSLNQRIEEQQQILRNDPENQQALLSLGSLNFNLKKYPESAKWYEQALRKDPENANILSDLATAYVWSNETDKAFDLFKKALAIDPKHFQTLMNLGIARMTVGDRKGAAEAWEKLVEYHPTHPEVPMIKDAVQRLRAQQTPPS